MGVEIMNTPKLFLLCLAIPAWNCANAADQSSNAPPSAAESHAKLDFLDEVPEFHDFDLTMSEFDLNELIAKYDLGVDITPENEKRDKKYRVWNKDGENVFIGFNDGKCTGIQRMLREPNIGEE